MTLESYLTDIYIPQRASAGSPLSAATISAYEIFVKRLDRFLHRKSTLDDLNVETMTAFGNWLYSNFAESTGRKTLETMLTLKRHSTTPGPAVV